MDSHRERIDELIERGDAADPASVQKSMLWVLRDIAAEVELHGERFTETMDRINETLTAQGEIARQQQALIDAHKGEDARRVAAAKGAYLATVVLFGALLTLAGYILADYMRTNAVDREAIRGMGMEALRRIYDLERQAAEFRTKQEDVRAWIAREELRRQR
jgi:hypothetical protein